MTQQEPEDMMRDALAGIRTYQAEGAGTFARDIGTVDAFASAAIEAASNARAEVAQIAARDDLTPGIKAQLRQKAIAAAEPVIADNIARSRLAIAEVVKKARATLVPERA